ncbi:MAG: transporter substrate-binding domain-containing protein, partial [Tistlia sp.]
RHMDIAAVSRAWLAALLLGGLLALTAWGGGVRQAGAAEAGFGQGSNPGAATTLRLVYEVTANPPRHLGAGTRIDWARPGLTLELLRLVGARLDIDFQFQRVPWKRGLFLVEQGLADGIFHTSHLPEREALLAYPRRADGTLDESRAIFVQSYLLYVRKGSPLRWDGTAFENLDGPVGAISSYSVVQDLRRMGVPVEEERSLTINLRKLLEGRIAASAELEGMGDAAIAAHPAFAGAIEKLQPPLRSKPYYLTFGRAFRDAEPELAERVWDAIAAEKAGPAFAALAESYESDGE